MTNIKKTGVVACALCLAVLLGGCATPKQSTAERREASGLSVDRASDARTVIAAVPAESAMERFGMLDRAGRHLSYVAFTDTDYGGLLFLEDKLVGTLSKRDAHAFYSCRGYVTATRHHWARDALDWADTLQAAAVPAEKVTLNFAGKATVQSIKEIVENPALSDVKSLVDMGTNPLSIFKTLRLARSNMIERDKYEKTQQALRTLRPGDSEQKVAEIVRPEDVSFTSDGMVMAYPRFSLDFYINGGVVKVLQQPSFHRLGRLHAAIFYLPNLRWDQCTAGQWRTALPPDWVPPPYNEDEPLFAADERKQDR